MTNRSLTPASLLARLGSLGGALLLAAACTTPSLPFHREGPFTDTFETKHPVIVQEAIATLTLEGDGVASELSAEEIGRVQAFSEGFIRRGSGRLMITIAGGLDDENVSLARGRQAAHEAVRFGLSTDDLVVRVDEAGERVADIVVLSFETHTAQLPVCRDWSKENSHNPNNTLFHDTGCSVQSNLGLMAANPGDLVSPRPNTSHDPVRIEDITTKYRIGTVTLTPRAPEETSVFAGF